MVGVYPYNYRTKKVFLGGLSLATEEADIREVLGVHGEIDNVQIMTDKESGKPRGFGFVTYTDFNPVDDVCCKKFIKIKVHFPLQSRVHSCIHT